MKRTVRLPRLSRAVGLGLTAALAVSLASPAMAVPSAEAPAVSISGSGTPAAESTGPAFHRLATLPAYANTHRGIETVAEISTVTPDGKTVVYTDAEAGGIGFVDITDPNAPRADGFLETAGSPTSVYATETYLMVVVDTSASFVEPTGKVVFVDLETRETLHELEVGGQPDSIDVTPDGKTAFIAMENQRDEDLGDGGLPQLPAGTLAMIRLTGALETLTVEHIDLTGLEGLDTPEDPEPEYVKTSPDGTKVALTLQENNGVVILDARSGEVLNHFNAGHVELNGVDTAEDGNLSLDGTMRMAPREPDAIGWIDDDHVATANEGDWKGGTRGWTVFAADTGAVVWDVGTGFEDLGHRYGQYPEHRSENKGTEPEGLTVATYGDTRYAFVGSERGNFVGVYDVTVPANPVFTQFLPSTNGPEGLLAVPERDLMVISSETDDAENGVRASIQVFQLGEGAAAVPTLKSADAAGGRADAPITWSALGALSAVPGQDDLLYAAPDSFLTPSRIYTVDTATHADGGPATIISELTLTQDGAPVGYDVEGLWADADGTFWLAVEGVKSKDPAVGSEGNRLVHVDASGEVLSEVEMPAEVAAGLAGQGFEGVTGMGSGQDAVLYTAVQRGSSHDPVNVARIGKYTVATGEWEWFGYPLETTDSEGDWIGLSEITAIDEDSFAVIERDKLNGPDAALKAVYAFTLPERGARTGEELPMVEKSLAVDVLPRLQELGGWTQEKLEGLTIAGNGNVYAVTDNDGAEDATGETVFLNVGAATEVFDGVLLPPAPVCEVPDFSDNAPGSQFYAPVRWLQCEGFANGYTDGTYRKSTDIKRGETLGLIYRYLAPEHTAPATSPFRDVKTDDTFYGPITWAAAQGVTTGYTDQSFRPYRPVTRGEFASFLYRAVDPEHTAPAASEFADVSTSSAHYQAITWLTAEGITTGYRDGTFRPHQPVTRGEVAAFLHRYEHLVAQQD